MRTAVLREAGVLDRPTVGGVADLTRRLSLYPAWVAGRVRKEIRNYSLLAKIVAAIV